MALQISLQQLEAMDRVTKKRLVAEWATSDVPVKEPDWDREELAHHTLSVADRFDISGPENQTRLHEIVRQLGPEFPDAPRFARHRMILAARDFHCTYRLEQLGLLMQKENDNER